MKLVLYFTLLCRIAAHVIDDFKEVRVVSRHWDALLNRVSLSPISLGNCATAVAKMDKAHLFKYHSQERKCTYAKFEDKGVVFWHSHLTEDWTLIYLARHFWSPSRMFLPKLFS